MGKTNVHNCARITFQQIHFVPIMVCDGQNSFVPSSFEVENTIFYQAMNFLDTSKSKAFLDNKLNVAEIMGFAFGTVIKIVPKG